MQRDANCCAKRSMRMPTIVASAPRVLALHRSLNSLWRHRVADPPAAVDRGALVGTDLAYSPVTESK